MASPHFDFAGSALKSTQFGLLSELRRLEQACLLVYKRQRGMLCRQCELLRLLKFVGCSTVRRRL